MRKRKLYLDTCILIAFHYRKDPKHKATKEFFKEISKINEAILFCSEFCLTEFVQAYSKKKDISLTEAYQKSNNMVISKKIDKYPFSFANVKGKEKNYDFSTFFVDLQEIILNAKTHLADAIHSIIMRNNKIKYIVTFNKDDFKNVEKSIPLTFKDVFKLLKKSFSVKKP